MKAEEGDGPPSRPFTVALIRSLEDDILCIRHVHPKTCPVPATHINTSPKTLTSNLKNPQTQTLKPYRTLKGTLKGT